MRVLVCCSEHRGSGATIKVVRCTSARCLLGPRLTCICHDAGLSKGLLEGGLAVGRFFAGTRGPAGLWRKPRLKQLFESGASLRLQFPKEDLGFAYRQGGASAVISEAGVQLLLQGRYVKVGAKLSYWADQYVCQNVADGLHAFQMAAWRASPTT